MEEQIKKEELKQVDSREEEKHNCDDDLFTDSADSQGTICLDIPEPSNAIRDLQIEKYLVPIFTSESESSFVGNGVIVGSYLITAAHVARNNEMGFSFLYYRFENGFKMVRDQDVVFDGRIVVSNNGNCNDLIIFKLEGIIGNLKCNDASIEKGTKLYSSFYSYNNDKGNIVLERNVCVVIHIGTFSLDMTTQWKNCFRVYNSHGFISGNSGCAFYKDGVLYGILLGGSDPQYRVNKYTVLDARYIKHIIGAFSE